MDDCGEGVLMGLINTLLILPSEGASSTEAVDARLREHDSIMECRDDSIITGKEWLEVCSRR
jgi:hypothetical protein